MYFLANPESNVSVAKPSLTWNNNTVMYLKQYVCGRNLCDSGQIPVQWQAVIKAAINFQ